MKRFYIIAIISIAFIPLYGQVTIGSEKSPEPFSILEMDSKEGGIRLNQLNVSDKESVTTKLKESADNNLTKGLTIFDMQTQKVQYWDGDKWAQMLSLEADENVDGLDGQFLMSNGAGKYPEWATLNIPKVQTGEFYLYSSSVAKDMKGANLPHKGEDVEMYLEDMLLNGPTSKNWVELTDLKTKITIPDISKSPGDPTDKVYNRIVFELQTGIQMYIGPKEFKIKDTSGTERSIKSQDDAWVSFTLGIFIGDDTNGYKLKQVRSTRLDPVGVNSFMMLTLIGAVDNLTSGEQTIKVAVKRRMQAKGLDNATEADRTLYIGKPVPGAPNYNNFMAQSFLRTDIYVIYD